MDAIKATNLKNQYFDWLMESESFTDAGSSDYPVVRIGTPFLDASYDGIDLYVYPAAGNQVLITDNGETLANLDAKGIVFDGRTETRNHMLDAVLSEFGISRQPETKKLFVRSTETNFPDAKQRLLQGILRIVDFEYTQSRTVKHLLQDEIATILSRHRVLYSSSKAIVTPNGQSFVFDFVIPTAEQGDTVVRAFRSPQFLNNAKVYSWDASLIDHYPAVRPNQYVAVVDDQNSKKKTLQSFKDVLSADPASDITMLPFSQLEKQIEVLSN